MSLTSYLAAPSRDLTMRLSARGGMIRTDLWNTQGKFCSFLKIVFFSRRDASPCDEFDPAPH